MDPGQIYNDGKSENLFPQHTRTNENFVPRNGTFVTRNNSNTGIKRKLNNNTTGYMPIDRNDKRPQVGSRRPGQENDRNGHQTMNRRGQKEGESKLPYIIDPPFYSIKEIFQILQDNLAVGDVPANLEPFCYLQEQQTISSPKEEVNQDFESSSSSYNNSDVEDSYDNGEDDNKSSGTIEIIQKKRIKNSPISCLPVAPMIKKKCLQVSNVNNWLSKVGLTADCLTMFCVNNNPKRPQHRTVATIPTKSYQQSIEPVKENSRSTFVSDAGIISDGGKIEKTPQILDQVINNDFEQSSYSEEEEEQQEQKTTEIIVESKNEIENKIIPEEKQTVKEINEIEPINQNINVNPVMQFEKREGINTINNNYNTINNNNIPDNIGELPLTTESMTAYQQTMPFLPPTMSQYQPINPFQFYQYQFYQYQNQQNVNQQMMGNPMIDNSLNNNLRKNPGINFVTPTVIPTATNIQMPIQNNQTKRLWEIGTKNKETGVIMPKDVKRELDDNRMRDWYEKMLVKYPTEKVRKSIKIRIVGETEWTTIEKRFGNSEPFK